MFCSGSSIVMSDWIQFLSAIRQSTKIFFLHWLIRISCFELNLEMVIRSFNMLTMISATSWLVSSYLKNQFKNFQREHFWLKLIGAYFCSWFVLSPPNLLHSYIFVLVVRLFCYKCSRSIIYLGYFCTLCYQGTYWSKEIKYV